MWLFLFAYEEAVDFDSRPTGATSFLVGRDEPSDTARTGFDEMTVILIQGGSNMTGTNLCVNKPVTVPVIFEPPCSRTEQSRRKTILFVATDGRSCLVTASVTIQGVT